METMLRTSRSQAAADEQIELRPAHQKDFAAGCGGGKRQLQWRFRKQVIAAHALCLLLVILPTGHCQQVETASNTTQATTTTTSKATSFTSKDSNDTLSSSTTTTTTITPEQFGSDAQSAGIQQQPTKLKPVNFTLVDELFESTLDDVELVRRWRNMDNQFQEGIRSILKLVFPQIVAISQDAKVSGDCSGGILKWILSLRNLRSWAIKMLDATGKPTSGIFEGSLTMFGNQRQCLSIRAPDEDEIEITDQFEEYFRGQFCVLHMRPWLGNKQRFYNLNSTVEPLMRRNYKYYEKTLYDELAEIAIAFNFIDIRMDLCVPSTCSLADIQRVADLLSRKLEMRAKVMRCDIESRDPTSSFVQNFDLTTLRWLVVPGTLIALTLISTLLIALGLFQRPLVGPANGRAHLARLLYCLSIQGAAKNLLNGSLCSSNNKHFVQDNNNNNNKQNAEKTTSTTKITNGFSTETRVYTQTSFLKQEILEKPLPLYGLRNIFIIWFMIVQLTVELNYQYLRESLVLRNMMLNYWPFQIIINTSMIFESLILITAFSFSYCNLESNVRQLFAYIVQKYVRLAPSIMTMIMITIITPTIGLTSPVWKNFVERQAQVCKTTGFLDMFFLQNFISYDKVCLPHTWLFCVELQLIILAVPLVLLLKRTFIHNEDSVIIGIQQIGDLTKPTNNKSGQNQLKDCRLSTTLGHLLHRSKAGLIGLLLVLLGTVANFALVYSNQLPPAWFHTFPDAEHKSFYFSKYLMKTWTHLTPFIIGLYAGYLCRATIQLIACNGIRQQQQQQREIFNGDSNLLVAATSVEANGVNNKRQDNGGVSSRLAAERSYCGQMFLKLAAFSSMLAILFSTFTWSTGQQLPTPLISALYDSLGRLIWSLALAGLIIKLCLPQASKQDYTSLSALLSQPCCLILGRLSFLAYLISPYVHTLILALQEQSLFPSLYLIFHVILGNIVITYLVALLLALLIEQPVRLALRQLLERRLGSRATRLQTTNGAAAAASTCHSANSTAATSAASLAS